MDESSPVHIFDAREHLKKNVARDHLSELFAYVLLEVGHIRAFQIHNEEVLLVVKMLTVHKVLDLENTLHASQFLQKLVLLDQDSFGFVWFFHFNCHLHVLFQIESFINCWKRPWTKLLAYFIPFFVYFLFHLTLVPYALLTTLSYLLNWKYWRWGWNQVLNWHVWWRYKLGLELMHLVELIKAIIKVLLFCLLFIFVNVWRLFATTTFDGSIKNVDSFLRIVLLGWRYYIHLLLK